MSIVEKRIKNLCGENHGLEISCIPGERTVISITLPAGGCREK
jgi:two-component system LytT family sensor kinase